jgi:hypothetical protein
MTKIAPVEWLCKVGVRVLGIWYPLSTRGFTGRSKTNTIKVIRTELRGVAILMPIARLVDISTFWLRAPVAE